LDDAIRPASHVDDLDRQGDFDLDFSRPEGEPTWLRLNTGVGIPCGFDQSVYLYEWHDNRWNRRFALEASDYRSTDYGPQDSVELQISGADPSGARLVLATAARRSVCRLGTHCI
jgi:hypothetical protein